MADGNDTSSSRRDTFDGIIYDDVVGVVEALRCVAGALCSDEESFEVISLLSMSYSF